MARSLIPLGAMCWLVLTQLVWSDHRGSAVVAAAAAALVGAVCTVAALRAGARVGLIVVAAALAVSGFIIGDNVMVLANDLLVALVLALCGLPAAPPHTAVIVAPHGGSDRLS